MLKLQKVVVTWLVHLIFSEPYLREVSEFIGVTDITFIHAKNLSEGAKVSQHSLAAAREAVY